MRKPLLGLFCCFLTVTAAYADQATVPNTFSAGTPAKAAEVNENFAALANVLKGMSRYSLYQNGKKIATPIILTLMKIDATGYLVAPLKNKNSSDVYLRGYPSLEPLFISYDCTGAAYTDQTIKEDLMLSEHGVVFHGGNGKAYTMSLPASPTSGITINSLMHNGSCYVRKDLSWFQAQPPSANCYYDQNYGPFILNGATTCANVYYSRLISSASTSLYLIQENNYLTTGIQTTSCYNSITGKPAVCVLNGEMKYE